MKPGDGCVFRNVTTASGPSATVHSRFATTMFPPPGSSNGFAEQRGQGRVRGHRARGQHRLGDHAVARASAAARASTGGAVVEVVVDADGAIELEVDPLPADGPLEPHPAARTATRATASMLTRVLPGLCMLI